MLLHTFFNRFPIFNSGTDLSTSRSMYAMIQLFFFFAQKLRFNFKSYTLCERIHVQWRAEKILFILKWSINHDLLLLSLSNSMEWICTLIRWYISGMMCSIRFLIMDHLILFSKYPTISFWVTYYQTLVIHWLSFSFRFPLLVEDYMISQHPHQCDIAIFFGFLI